jgi:hypothetical protein
MSSAPVVFVVRQRLYSRRGFLFTPAPAVEEKAEQRGEGKPDEDDPY